MTTTPPFKFTIYVKEEEHGGVHIKVLTLNIVLQDQNERTNKKIKNKWYVT
jgi:hypothetical protein